MEPGVERSEQAEGRRARKKERTRREIYEAALALFAERGVDAVTIEEICQRADVARATFFLHFPAKGELLFEYGRVVAAGLAAQLGDGRESASDQFRRVAEVMARCWLEQADVMRGMLRELLADPRAPGRAPGEADDLLALVTSLVRRGQERGEFRSGIAPRVAASAFLSSSLAFLAAPRQPRRPERLRDQLVDLVLHGLVEPGRR